MNRVEQLIRQYELFVTLPWPTHLAGPQKIWFLVYDKSDERRIRARLGEIELATRNSGHDWVHFDLTDIFAAWMANEDYRESYFQAPEDLELLLPQFRDHVTQALNQVLLSPQASNNALVAITGMASLFGFLRMSDLLPAIAPSIKGRSLFLFPGEYENSNYRLLDARDGWNYLAVPITVHSGDAP